MKKYKKILTGKPEVKKDLENLLPSFQSIPIEASPPIILANIPKNINSELEINFKGKIKLEVLLDEFKKNILGENQKFVDSTFLAKKFLDVYTVESTQHPIDYRSSYTSKGFDTGEEKLIPVETIDVKPQYKIKILQVKDSKNYNFVLKRCWTALNIGSMTLEEFNEITKFLIDKYTEYAANKLYYACRYSAKIAGYHIIQLINNSTNQMMLVTEMLSVFAGITLSKVFPVKDSSTILAYFIQILHAGNFLEAYKIEHNDIKPNNFLIEFLDKVALIKLIDFDVGAIQPQDLPTNKSLGCKGFSDGYVAPEILLIVQSGYNLELQMQMLSELNPWKCHSYSMGILMLEMIGFIPNIMKLKEFDPLKNTEPGHNKILSKLKEYYNKETDIILKNIIHLVILCLLYNPENRASVKEILTLIEHIDQKDSYSIEREYKELCDKRKPNRTKLKARIEELNNQINPLQMQNKFLNEERNSLIQSLNNQFPDANLGINDNLCAKTWEIINRIYNSFGTQIKAKENEISQLGLRIKELNEYNDSSVKKMDAQIQILNQNVQQKEEYIKVQENKIKEKENENERLKKKLNDLEIKNKQYEAKEKTLTNEKEKYQKQVLEKDEIIEQITQENNRINGEFNSEKQKSNENIVNINRNQKVIEEQKEDISKLKEKIQKNDSNYQSIISKLKNFFSILLKIIQNKGFEIVIVNDPFDEILEIVERFLPDANKEISKETKNIPEEKKAPRIEVKKNEQKENLKINLQESTTNKGYNKVIKYKNYEDAFNQIVNGNKLRKEIVEYIKSKMDYWWWWFEKGYHEATQEEILNILELIKVSEKIQKLTFTENPNFDAKCERAYLEAIKENNSLFTIILYLTNVSNEVTLEMLKILEIKPNIKVLVVEKAKIEDKDAQELSKKMNLEINNWKSKYWR